MTEAQWAYTTTLSKGGVTIAEVTSIGGLELDSDEIDVTHLMSPGGYEEVIQTIRRTGVVTLEGNFVPGDAGQADLMADYLSGAVHEYKITFPTAMATEWTFDAFVKKAPSTEAAMDGAVSFSAELRVTGQPTLDITYSDGLTTPWFVVSDTVSRVPDPADDIYSYVVNVANATASVTVTPTAAAGVIKVNGAIVASGAASSAITLGAAGTLTDIHVEVKEAGKIARNYVITIARAA